MKSNNSVSRFLLLMGVWIWSPHQSAAYNVVNVTGSVNVTTGALVPNVFQTLTVWGPYAVAPTAGLKEAYPFLEYIEVFTATGGCYSGYPGCEPWTDRDLFVDNAVGPSSGYNASALISALASIVTAGFLPHIVTGNVPIALSAAPHIGGFGFNSAPPSNYTEYREYVAGVVSQVVHAFSRDEVSTWRWGVYTEFNNQDWLNGTAQQYMDLYDYTVCGLQDAMGGPQFVNVGAHACSGCGGGAWDPTVFLEHVASGSPACVWNGSTSTLEQDRSRLPGPGMQLNFTANSFYEMAPGSPGDLSSFVPTGLQILRAAENLSISTAVYGIDEGRILSGPETPTASYPLSGTRAIARSYQASFDALFFKLLAQSGSPGAYYSRWGVNTAPSGPFSAPALAVDTVATNVAQLAYRMTGGLLVPLTNSSTLNTWGSIVDGIASYHINATTTILRVLIFNHYPVIDASGIASQNASVTICGLPSSVAPGPIGGQNATMWRVGDSNANFWLQWRADAAAANISRENGDYQDGDSEWDERIPLASQNATDVFGAQLPLYQALAKLVPMAVGSAASASSTAVVADDGCVMVSAVMPPHSVALMELRLA